MELKELLKKAINQINENDIHEDTIIELLDNTMLEVSHE